MSYANRKATFVLIHSPLTGPEVWWPVANLLSERGHAAVVVDLQDSRDNPWPLWQQHVASAVGAIVAHQADVRPNRTPIILVGHSGAGPLLGAISAALTPPPTGAIFVDAGLPPQFRASRLDLIRAEGDQWVEEFEAHLTAGGLFPNWSDADLRDTLPELSDRRLVLDTLRPRGLGYFCEQLESFGDLSDLPGAYIQWTSTYEVHAAKAMALGWPVFQRSVGHFQMLADGQAVANDLVSIVDLIAGKWPGNDEA